MYPYVFQQFHLFEQTVIILHLKEAPWTSDVNWNLSDVCGNDTVEVVASPRERALGVWLPSQLRRAFLLRKICGVLVLREVLNLNVLKNVSAAISSSLPTMTGGVKDGMEDLNVEASSAPRGHRRWEVKVPLEEPFVHEDWEGKGMEATREHVACTLSCSSHAYTVVYIYIYMSYIKQTYTRTRMQTYMHTQMIYSYSYTKMFQYKTHVKSMAPSLVMIRQAFRLHHPNRD